MSADDDFEQQMTTYSEIETISKEEVEAALPQTIRRYKQKIRSNNTASIFDADYSSYNGTDNDDMAPKTNKKATLSSNEDLGVFKDEKITYVVSGRGRGGRNIFITPGPLNKSNVLNRDDEITQQIRKVAPIGYSNQITENAIRAHKRANAVQQENLNYSPTRSRSSNSSPSVSKPSSTTISPSTLKTELNRDANSPVLLSGQPVNVYTKSPDPSRYSTSYTTASDNFSSEYFTSQDHNESSDSPKNTQSEAEFNRELTNTEELPSDSSPQDKLSTSQEVIPKKPVPLSVMLKQSRQAHKRRQFEEKQALSNDYLSQNFREDDLASQKKIRELLQQDVLELQKENGMKKKTLSDHSSSSSISSRREQLSWRRRNNSPPRYAWGQNDRKINPGKLDINSLEDFPAL